MSNRIREYFEVDIKINKRVQNSISVINFLILRFCSLKHSMIKNELTKTELKKNIRNAYSYYNKRSFSLNICTSITWC